MAKVSYQTITVSKGKHDSPEDGTCVMELASMLAGEPFNDHPQSVCPVIGSFLRAYNDRIDDGRRQDLCAYAAKVVGSRASEDVEYARAERLRAWALELHWSGWLQRLFPARLRALLPRLSTDLVGSHAVCALPQHNDRTHTQVMDLIDELLTIGAGKQPTIQPPENDDANPSASSVASSDRDSCALLGERRYDRRGWPTKSGARRPADAQALQRHRQPTSANTHTPTVTLLPPKSIAEEPAAGRRAPTKQGSLRERYRGV